MVKKVILFFDVVVTGLVAGTIFGVWIGYNPIGLSAEVYVTQQQHAIGALNVLMPILGLIAIVSTLISAFLRKQDKLLLSILLLAAVLLILSALVTRFGNQPINAIVLTWDLASIPSEWAALRDQWWKYHVVRTLATMVAFACIAWVSVSERRPNV
ncbi:MAG TPA: DUF1772 domain-containing protein [Chryseolinea sp.]|nr:DUF1772 domain-containing protein [Chryseolinea sp.]